MKKLLIILFLFTNLQAENWTPVSKEQLEYKTHMENCGKIIEHFTSLGATLSSPSISTAIFEYLKKANTKTSFLVLKEQIKMGRVPQSYLVMM